MHVYFYHSNVCISQIYVANDEDINLLHFFLDSVVTNIMRTSNTLTNLRVEINNADSNEENVVYVLRQLIGDFELRIL